MQLAYFSSQIKCVSCVFSVSVSILYSRWTQMNDIVARYLRYNTLRWWLVGQRTLDIASNPNWKYLAERQESAQIKRVIPLWNIITIHSHSAPRPGPNIIINQLEKLEAAKAAWLVCLSLLSLTGSFWVVLGQFLLTLRSHTGLYWALLGLI